MQYSYVIIDDSADNIKEILQRFEDFPEYYCIGTCYNREDALNIILEQQPELVFLNIKGKAKTDISLSFIYELYRYQNEMPYFVILADTDKFAFEALKLGVFDYIINPVETIELRKTLFKFQKIVPLSGGILPKVVENVQQTPEKTEPETERINADASKSEVDIQVCIKSYGDYQFIALKDVVYLQADNNTTDFHLQNGKKLTAYKTLKHYENNLPSFFYRIHNSYIVNSNFVSRINTGKSLCYLLNNEISLSFSKTFKDNIDTIIKKIAPEYI